MAKLFGSGATMMYQCDSRAGGIVWFRLDSCRAEGCFNLILPRAGRRPRAAATTREEGTFRGARGVWTVGDNINKNWIVGF